VTDLQSEVE